MNRRLLLAATALAALTLTAGCLSFFTGTSISDETLDAQPVAEYDWDADADAHIELTEDAQFTAVYRVNTTEMTLYRRDAFGGREPISASAFRYRYPNGTVINGSAFDEHGGDVTKSRDEITVTFPTDGPTDGSARFAFSAESTPKQFSLPVYVEGSYQVLLPPNRRIEVPILGRATPSGYDTTDVGDRTLIRWESVTTNTVSVQYYLQRDLVVFAVILTVASVVAVVGALHYQRQIRRLQRRREEVGPDVDTGDDDDDRGPPPGMR
jgi:hypothetical protein